MTVDHLTKDDLSEISWSGSPTHLQYVAKELDRVVKGETDYLAVKDDEGRIRCVGLIEHVRRAGMGGSEIGQLATHPDFRSMGYGSRLIEAAEELIRRRGRQWSVLGVEEENVRALKLYERLGYQAYGKEEASWTQEDGQGNTYVHTAREILLRKRV